MGEKIKDLVLDPDWQSLRKQLLGNWINNPIWCCKKLQIYLGNIKKCPYNKLRIVFNYLIGTGFRTGKISHPCIDSLRKSISIEIKRRKSL